MTNVTIQLEGESQQILVEQARSSGQTLEDHLQQILEQHVRGCVVSSDDGLDTNDEASAERPWRGGFVPPRARRPLFSRNISSPPDQLGRRRSKLNMNWHRTGSDDE
jgi:hypothetical protein